MTRKPLPKAIRPDNDRLRAIRAEPEVEVIEPARVAAAAPASAAAPVSSKASARPQSEEAWPASPPPANDTLPAAIPMSLAAAEARLRQAFRIVERHQMYSGLGGLVPLPAISVVGVTAANLRMVQLLCKLYGVPFERDKMRAFIIGMMGGAAPTGLAAATAATLAFTPVAGAFGIAVSTVAAATLTRRIGLHFIERFEQTAAF